MFFGGGSAWQPAGYCPWDGGCISKRGWNPMGANQHRFPSTDWTGLAPLGRYLRNPLAASIQGTRYHSHFVERSLGRPTSTSARLSVGVHLRLSQFLKKCPQSPVSHHFFSSFFFHHFQQFFRMPEIFDPDPDADLPAQDAGGSCNLATRSSTLSSNRKSDTTGLRTPETIYRSTIFF